MTALIGTVTGNDSVAVTGKASAGERTLGVRGEGDSSGVQGIGKAWNGVEGISHSTIGGAGVFGANDTGVGVRGESKETYNPAIQGIHKGQGGAGVQGEAENFVGVIGVAGPSTLRGVGVYGQALRPSEHYPSRAVGVWGDSKIGIGVFGSTGHLYGGWFEGILHVDNYVETGGGGFKIDHPLDPARKYLSHSFVESSEMKNLYDGVAVLNSKGAAVIKLPNWFEPLNQDFRYQLTPLGAPAPDLHIAEEIRDKRFKIAGGKPGMKVSWQVTGVRRDAFAKKYRMPVEETKPKADQGYYAHPEAHGQPREKGILSPRSAADKKLQKDLMETTRRPSSR